MYRPKRYCNILVIVKVPLREMLQCRGTPKKVVETLEDRNHSKIKTKITDKCRYFRARVSGVERLAASIRSGEQSSIHVVCQVEVVRPLVGFSTLLIYGFTAMVTAAVPVEITRNR